MRAPNCDKPASTRTNWANEAKEIAAGIARLAEGACKRALIVSAAVWFGTAQRTDIKKAASVDGLR